MTDRTMDRRSFLERATAAGALAALRPARAPAPPAPPAPPVPPVPPFELEEATIAELRAGMEAGKYSARGLAAAYLERIAALDRPGPNRPGLRAVLEVNPDALAQAAALDAERKAKGPRGPLHGIPVLVKDNIATRDRMETTAGSLALVGAKPPRDAFVVERLRAAGAVILGKANLSEWANFRSTHSSSGWSGRGGQCRNPYALDRTPSGSSSGSAVAVAANLCAAAVGTETDGSIVSPATCCSIVGIKPTLGLVSRAGIIPIAHSQDTAGPMARTVADAAALLGVLAGVDPADDATAGGAGGTRLHELPRPRRPARRPPRGLPLAFHGVQPRHGRPVRGGVGRAPAARRRARGPGRHRHRRPVRRLGAHRAVVRVQGRLEPLPGRVGAGRRGTDARGPDRVQRAGQGHRAAVLRPRAVRPGAGEGAAHRARVLAGPRQEPPARAHAGD